MSEREDLESEVAAWQRLKDVGEQEGDRSLVKVAESWIGHYRERIRALDKAVA